MELMREHWTAKDASEFQEYLLGFSKGIEKGEWEKRIINTQLPCIAVDSKQVAAIVKKIAQGNFIEFLDLDLCANFTNISINGSLICRIKDFDLMKKYLKKYAAKIDNWAACDLLKFKITDKNKPDYFALSQQYIACKKPFERRIGIIILFKFVNDDAYIDRIFDVMNGFENETDYYVNMANAWLFAECFTKQRSKTLHFLETHKLNKFTINKGIQKCRDSFRVSSDDKEMLLQYKQ